MDTKNVSITNVTMKNLTMAKSDRIPPPNALAGYFGLQLA